MDKKNNSELKIAQNLEGIKHKIVILSGKGGVGKSTVSANLAIKLSDMGNKVGLLDSDIHGPSIPKILGVEDNRLEMNEVGINPVSVNSNLKVISIAFLTQDKDSPVIWRGPLKMSAIKQFLGEVNWGELDYLIIDLPPGTGDEPLSITQLMPKTTGVIIVTTPQDVALLSVRKSINFVKKMNMNIIGIIENMSGFICPHCKNSIDIFKSGGGLKASKDFLIPFLGKIPLDPQIVISGDSGNTLMITNTKSDTTKAFKEIIENIKKNINKKEVKYT